MFMEVMFMAWLLKNKIKKGTSELLHSRPMLYHSNKNVLGGNRMNIAKS